MMGSKTEPQDVRMLMRGWDDLDRPVLLHIQPEPVSMHLGKIRTNI